MVSSARSYNSSHVQAADLMFSGSGSGNPPCPGFKRTFLDVPGWTRFQYVGFYSTVLDERKTDLVFRAMLAHKRGLYVTIL